MERTGQPAIRQLSRAAANPRDDVVDLAATGRLVAVGVVALTVASLDGPAEGAPLNVRWGLAVTVRRS